MPTNRLSLCSRCHRPRPKGTKCLQCYPPFTTSAWARTLDPINRRRWRTVRGNYLALHPVCEWPECVGLAHEVDHVVNLKTKGVNPFDYRNLQSLCTPHHATKTGREGYEARRANEVARIKRNLGMHDDA